LAEWSINDYVKEFNSYAPSYVKGYPSALYDFCKLAIAQNLDVRKVKAVYTASETLHEYQRKIIEDVFDSELYQWYGQVETTVNVHECISHRLHVKEEYGLLEILRTDDSPSQNGEEGRVVGTGWGNKAFPLLRYNTGDNMILAADQYCDCGMGGRIIDRILGRDEDVIVTPDGRRLGRMDFIFKPISSVLESQIVQDSADSVLIRIVPDGEYGSREERQLRLLLSDFLGANMNIKFELIDSIPRSANGKIRYVVSNVAKTNIRYSNETADTES
jgi:phenylacetate-coenzyme A ligase PaaK-like adenylate-forming protein